MIGKAQGLIARQIDMEIGIPMMDIRKIVRKIDPKKSFKWGEIFWVNPKCLHEQLGSSLLRTYGGTFARVCVPNLSLGSC